MGWVALTQQWKNPSTVPCTSVRRKILSDCRAWSIRSALAAERACTLILCRAARSFRAARRSRFSPVPGTAMGLDIGAKLIVFGDCTLEDAAALLPELPKGKDGAVSIADMAALEVRGASGRCVTRASTPSSRGRVAAQHVHSRPRAAIRRVQGDPLQGFRQVRPRHAKGSAGGLEGVPRIPRDVARPHTHKSTDTVGHGGCVVGACCAVDWCPAAPHADRPNTEHRTAFMTAQRGRARDAASASCTLIARTCAM